MAGVSYSERDSGWFDKRVLRRHARVLHLWAMGVGAVISGDFFGWNFGFQAGGLLTGGLGADWIEVHKPTLEDRLRRRLQRPVHPPVQLNSVVQRAQNAGDGLLLLKRGQWNHSISDVFR